jgi:hypothetical protein
LPLNALCGAAAGAVLLGCAWTLYANVFGASIYPAVTASGVETADSTTPLHVSAQRKNTVALLTAAYPPELTFSERMAALDRPSVASVSEPGNQGNIRLDLQADSSKPKVDSPPAPRRVASIPASTGRAAEPHATQVEQRAAQPEPRAAQNDKSPDGDMVRRAKATVVASTGSTPSIFEKLFGKPQADGPKLAYASAEAGVQSDGRDISDTPAPYDRSTAVYDISAHMVYMPDGTKLEAHSGLGSRLDDPRFVRERMRGPTPPHIYDLSLRESLFHGVPALRLKPVGGDDAVFGRSGLLAHTYMLGPNGDSNGCVSFRNYDAFLQAYKNEHVKRLVVVAHL